MGASTSRLAPLVGRARETVVVQKSRARICPRTVPSPPRVLSLETRNLIMGKAGAGIIAFGLAMACVLLALPGCEGFYLPGVAPQDFALGDIIQPRVGRVSSAKTHIPFGERSRPQARAPPLHC